VNKALVELKMKMAAIKKKEKQKAAVVNKLFAGTEIPFTKQVIDHLLPNKYKAPQILSYIARSGTQLRTWKIIEYI
jgi:ribosome maturation protein Sdo1